ncbi:hypothetical protein NJL88_11565 [Streptomyces sp. DK15]|uniref:hypothetical protein n=1 Tax=Streptomyces sp. DK15 TaxID=2957499 RepID=UPI0029B9593D|nr:hypothetical protein [Streptomyces sp. DK15]MDX2390691.1 hypothetical protein [Streptomyces sp. DK15]
MPNTKALETANAILDEWHEAGIPPVIHWRNHWYEFIDNTYYKRSAGWMLRKVTERVGPKLQTPIYSALLGLSIQPDVFNTPPPPGPRGRVQRKESQ